MYNILYKILGIDYTNNSNTTNKYSKNDIGRIYYSVAVVVVVFDVAVFVVVVGVVVGVATTGAVDGCSFLLGSRAKTVCVWE